MSRLVFQCLILHSSPPPPILDISEPHPSQQCAEHLIKYLVTKIKGKNLSRINGRRSVGCNRDVKVNVKWGKGSIPFIMRSKFTWDRPEQVRDSSGKLWIECGNCCLLPPVGLLCIDTQAEPLKVCWMSERVTGLLCLEDRSRRISILLTPRAEMVQCVEGICHQQSCRWSRGLGRASDPTKWENKTRFSAGTRMIFTLGRSGIWFSTTSSSHLTSLLWSHFGSS